VVIVPTTSLKVKRPLSSDHTVWKCVSYETRRAGRNNTFPAQHSVAAVYSVDSEEPTATYELRCSLLPFLLEAELIYFI
jgi:hypothetical protein